MPMNVGSKMIFIAMKNIRLRDNFSSVLFFNRNIFYYSNDFSSHCWMFIIMINVHHNNVFSMMKSHHNRFLTQLGIANTIQDFHLRDEFLSKWRIFISEIIFHHNEFYGNSYFFNRIPFIEIINLKFNVNKSHC